MGIKSGLVTHSKLVISPVKKLLKTCEIFSYDLDTVLSRESFVLVILLHTFLESMENYRHFVKVI